MEFRAQLIINPFDFSNWYSTPIYPPPPSPKKIADINITILNTTYFLNLIKINDLKLIEVLTPTYHASSHEWMYPLPTVISKCIPCELLYPFVNVYIPHDSMHPSWMSISQAHTVSFHSACTLSSHKPPLFSSMQRLEFIDICELNPCQNNATCVSISIDNYTCTCLPGFSGENCETGKLSINFRF